MTSVRNPDGACMLSPYKEKKDEIVRPVIEDKPPKPLRRRKNLRKKRQKCYELLSPKGRNVPALVF